MTEVFINALSNRFPDSTRNPAFSRIGSLTGRITSRSSLSMPARFSPIVRPVAVIAPMCNIPAFASSPITAGTPPARKKLSPRYSPAGCMFTSSGASKPTVSQSFTSSATPACRAMAARCGGALVDPPIAVLTTMAFSKASRVRMSDGFRSSSTICTIRLPVSYAMFIRSRNGAGIADEPVSVIPSASAIAFMVLAVPIVLQWPRLGAEAQARFMNSA